MTVQALISLPGNESTGAALAQQLNVQLLVPEVRAFPDGETYFRLDADLRALSTAIVCTLDRPDTKLMRLLVAVDNLRHRGASCVGLVAPYLAYMRQDTSFHPGEAVSARAFGAVLSQHFDWIVTVDPHLHRIRSLSEVFRMPSRAVHCADLIAEWIASNVREPILIGPDSESMQWVREVAAKAGAPYLVLQKVRRGDRDVVISLPDMQRWHEHTPVLVDDIISTGLTMNATLRQLQSAKMRPAACVGVHAIFAAGAIESLRTFRPTHIVTTNTITHSTNAIDVSRLVADGIRSIAG